MSFAQDDVSKFIPPSPNAYSLGKYGDIPVSLYTGIPNISIPLYNVDEKDFSIPISLSYHGGGIKVDETSSDIGLGWALNAGGVITRSIRGRAEYLSNGVLRPTRADLPLCTNCNNAANINNYVAQNNLSAIVDGQIDSEPDVFYYNFNGRTGKFYFDKNGVPLLEKNDALQISWMDALSSNDEVFVIVDEMGIRYEFFEREFTYYGTNEGLEISAWYLSKIVSPKGKTVTFTYSNYHFSKTERNYSSQLVHIPSNQTSGVIYSPAGPTTYTSSFEVGLRIKEIVTATEKIEFTFNGSRADLPSLGARLEYVSVRKVADSGLIKKFQLFTSYFEANHSRKYSGPFPAQNQHLNYRLRLDSVKQVSESGTEVMNSFKLFYLGDDDPNTDDPYTLPHRLSASQDYWGYYNQAFNSHLLPGMSNKYLESSSWYVQFTADVNYGNTSAILSLTGGADRSVNNMSAMANTLQRLEYPTGGFTEFEFESNDYLSFQGGIRVKTVKSYAAADSDPIEINYIYEAYSAYDLDPEKYSFEYYYIGWDVPSSSSTPSVDILNMFSLTPANGYDARCVKVLSFPTAILVALSNIGHSNVTVQQPGNGHSITYFASSNDYADYFNTESIYEETYEEADLLNNLYVTEGFSVSGVLFGYEMKTIGYGSFPYNELYSNDWKRGVMTGRRTYSESGSLIKSEDFEYYRKLNGVVPGFKVLSWSTGNNFLYGKYLMPHSWSQMKRSVITEYDANGLNPLVNETKYYYDNLNHLQLTRTENNNSKGVVETLSTTYPLDYPSGTAFIDSMTQKHLWAYPIEKSTYRTSQESIDIVAGSLLEYQNNGKGLPQKVFNLETSKIVSQTAFKFSNRPIGVLPIVGSSTFFDKDVRYALNKSFNLYDVHGNVLEQQNTSNIKHSFIWGYDNQYPIAVVNNAPVNEIAYTSFEDDSKGNWTFVGTPTVDATAPSGKKRYLIANASENIAKTGLSSTTTYIVSYWKKNGSGNIIVNGTIANLGRTIGDWTYHEHVVASPVSGTITISGINGIIDELRLYPAEAQMISYTYDPVIGVTGQYDVNNKSTYYEYDGFGRLIIVRDEYKNVIRRICYNLYGQQENCDAQ